MLLFFAFAGCGRRCCAGEAAFKVSSVFCRVWQYSLSLCSCVLVPLVCVCVRVRASARVYALSLSGQGFALYKYSFSVYQGRSIVVILHTMRRTLKCTLYVKKTRDKYLPHCEYLSFGNLTRRDTHSGINK